MAWWPTLVVLLVACFTDLRSRRIPNWLVLPYLPAGIAVSAWQGGWHGVGMSLMGVLVGLLGYGVFYLMGGMGAGDVKLVAAVGAWIGPMQLLMALLVASLAGGVMALLWAIAGGFVGELFSGTGELAAGLFRRKGQLDPEMTLANPKRRKMPYAPAIAVGVVFTFLGH